MSFMKSVGALPKIDTAIQRGRGAAAAVIGQTYDVRRLDANTNVSVSSNTPVFSGFPARLRRTTDKKAIEGQIFELIVFIATCDNRSLVLMDQLTETGYEAQEAATYIFAQARPTRETVFVRSEATVFLTRPNPTALHSSQQPAMGGRFISAMDGWSGIAAADERVLTLTNGMYAFRGKPQPGDPPVVPAQLACGLSANARFHEGKTLGVPVEQYRDQFLCYLPMLPGEQLNEIDRINFGGSDRYKIAKILTTEYTGLSGYVLFVEKLGF